MYFLLSLFPILLILLLMVGLRWGASRAGSAGYLIAMAIAIFFFGAELQLLAYAHVKAMLLALDVLLVIWAAFLLYRVSDEAGAIKSIGNALPFLTSDRGMQALIIGWAFASFLQGVGGFGVPVAIVAPILVGLGFSPLSAVVIPSIGHGWAVTFGSMGSSFQALLASTGQPEIVLAPPTALFLGASCLITGVMVAHAADGWSAVRRLRLPILTLGISMALIQYLTATTGPWNVAAFLGGLGGLIIGYPLAMRFNFHDQTVVLDRRGLVVALSAYIALIFITLCIQFVPALNHFLGNTVVQIHFPEVSTSLGYVTPEGPGRKLVIFRHAGVILLYASILGSFIYYRAGLYNKGAVGRILSGTVHRVMSSSVSIISMVAMAVIMEHSGMTDTLARGLANSIRGFFPIVSPWIGAIGSFMTGSNTNSNVVFGNLQLRTARLLGYSVPIILAAQTAGAALASVMAPTKIVVGASTAGMAGKEGEIMRNLLVYAAILVFVIGLFTLIAS